MCTVSWVRLRGGYELFCNRDERRTRKPAASPVVRERRGVRFVAPVDGEHGGSWIGVNEFGITLCLLNRYEGARPRAESAAPGGAYLSRGLLPMGLLDCRTLCEVRARALASDLSRYQPFTLAALAPDEPALLVHWRAGRKTFDGAGDASVPLTSSSYRVAEVIAARRALFRRAVDGSGSVTPALLREFHGSHDPAAGPYSVCMHRDDAATVSFSHVSVNEQWVEFSYQPLSPCAHSRAARVRVPAAREELQER